MSVISGPFLTILHAQACERHRTKKALATLESELLSGTRYRCIYPLLSHLHVSPSGLRATTYAKRYMPRPENKQAQESIVHVLRRRV